MQSRKCYKCQSYKTLDNFVKSKNKASGFHGYCKSCHSIGMRERKRKALNQYIIKNSDPAIPKFEMSYEMIKQNGGNDAIKAMERAGYKCEICGVRIDLTIHHKDRQGRNYTDIGKEANNALENLQVLCRKCHGSVHSKQGYFALRRYHNERNGFTQRSRGS